VTRTGLRVVVGSVGLAAAGYAVLAGAAWLRYGAVPADGDPPDRLLDRFMPTYEIVERHQVRINAPAALALAAAKEQELGRVPLIRAVFRTRRAVMGGTTDRTLPPTLLAQMLSIGWRILAEDPDREVVVGAVTQPWHGNVVFTPVPSDVFAGWSEPGYVKIVWSLRVDPVDEWRCVFRTETRAVATDPEARRRFRRYWSLVSPGVWLIRRLSLGPLKAAAEERYAARPNAMAG
jgi:hypothetical protein